ncbi:hypothetical protein CLAFUW4_05819 [Fulvia fulva]|uniref:Uncharacterized protein n=1 Tax=Passalora fulva TaxID=5499 RepID=A0A9Q8P9C7_PASFU|nr:uncharacterized protein CLAFUR5_05960 [Fulvia fulva]KAK4624361.1 hypothetical protein CLAFUR4_05813 [Fulvia fulva]KAK4625789.1 hypothetical protein CLAFUR0_05824 [Fulvia fulva]UJO17912.1 hypothetical protein CLAFUR5_05960 [Fulvia fulva]WPV15422.1 hypothetical protein CLAFUW4_05819 [Fulvia fulva]WPV29644.1 hypothetical protein CLAFUW7_05817 [Fulvia fulva]
MLANVDRPWTEEVDPMVNALVAVIEEQNLQMTLRGYQNYLAMVAMASSVMGSIVSMSKAWSFGWWVLWKLVALRAA